MRLHTLLPAILIPTAVSGSRLAPKGTSRAFYHQQQQQLLGPGISHSQAFRLRVELTPDALGGQGDKSPHAASGPRWYLDYRPTGDAGVNTAVAVTVAAAGRATGALPLFFAGRARSPEGVAIGTSDDDDGSAMVLTIASGGGAGKKGPQRGGGGGGGSGGGSDDISDVQVNAAADGVESQGADGRVSLSGSGRASREGTYLLCNRLDVGSGERLAVLRFARHRPAPHGYPGSDEAEDWDAVGRAASPWPAGCTAVRLVAECAPQPVFSDSVVATPCVKGWSSL